MTTPDHQWLCLGSAWDIRISFSGQTKKMLDVWSILRTIHRASSLMMTVFVCSHIKELNRILIEYIGSFELYVSPICAAHSLSHKSINGLVCFFRSFFQCLVIPSAGFLPYGHHNNALWDHGYKHECFCSDQMGSWSIWTRGQSEIHVFCWTTSQL